MSWLFLILMSVVTYSFSVILQKVVLKNDQNDPIMFSVIFQLITGLIIGTYAVTTSQLIWQPINSLWPNMVFMAGLYGVGNIFIFKSLQLVDASKFSILFATRGLFTIIASSILLGEALQNMQYLGAVLILVGIILVNIANNKIIIARQDLYAIVAALLFGIANTNDRFLLGSLNLYQFVTLSFIISALLVGTIYFKNMYKVKVYFQNGLWKRMIFLSVVYAISSVMFFAALQLAPNSSQVAAINLTSTILISILGITFLNEKTNMVKKLLGAIVSFVGLILVSK